MEWKTPKPFLHRVKMVSTSKEGTYKKENSTYITLCEDKNRKIYQPSCPKFPPSKTSLFRIHESCQRGNLLSQIPQGLKHPCHDRARVNTCLVKQHFLLEIWEHRYESNSKSFLIIHQHDFWIQNIECNIITYMVCFP